MPALGIAEGQLHAEREAFGFASVSRASAAFEWIRNSRSAAHRGSDGAVGGGVVVSRMSAKGLASGTAAAQSIVGSDLPLD